MRQRKQKAPKLETLEGFSNSILKENNLFPSLNLTFHLEWEEGDKGKVCSCCCQRF